MDGIKYTTSEEIEKLKNEIAVEKLKPRYMKEKRREQNLREKTSAIFSEAEKSHSEINNLKTDNPPDVTTRKKSPILKLIVNVIFGFLVIFLVVILVSILVAKNTGQTPKVFGYQLFIVKTGSMIPTFPIGTIILVKEPKNSDKLKVGTIASFVRKGNIVTHRIVEVVRDNGKVMYRTKGDNPENSIDLDLVSPKDIKGEFVLKIPIPTFSK